MKLRMPSRAACTLTAGMVLLIATTIFAQQFSTATSKDEKTAKLICSYVERYHISQHQIDDEISQKVLDRFLKSLDPQKLYFTQPDIDQFQAFRHELDNLLKAGDVKFAYDTFNVYASRVSQRTQYAKQLIDAEHDFTLDESIVVDPDEIEWARDETEMNERWRKRIKLELLNLRLDEMLKAELAAEEASKPEPSKPGPSKPEASPSATEAAKLSPRERLHKRYNRLQKSILELESSEKLEMYLTALTHCFDPHSSYMSPNTVDEFRIDMELSLEGIGAALRSEDGYTTVAEIIRGGAADKDGRVKVGDKIIGVGQDEGGDVEDIVEMKLSKVVRLIRGKQGTKVRLRVQTGETGEIQEYVVTRQKIELHSREVRGEILDTSERFPSRPAHKIGVINIPSFYRDFRGAQRGLDDFKSTVRDLEKVLQNFRDQGGVDAVIIDLRYNGGGALKEAIDVSGLFISEGPVVQVKELNKQVKSHDDEDPHVAYVGPLVILCNRLSASASEIFAGVIKDYHRGLIIGDTSTHGKGTVQNVIPVTDRFQLLPTRDRDLGALKLTINQFYRVNGHSTQKEGVESDVVLPSLLDEMDLGEEHLENPLPFDQTEAASFSPLGYVNEQMVDLLRKASKQRVAEDPKFQELQRDIQKYVERKNRKAISLNEEVRHNELLADKKGKKDDKKLPRQLDGNGPIFPDEYYPNEVLQITLDYLALHQQSMTVQR